MRLLRQRLLFGRSTFKLSSGARNPLLNHFPCVYNRGHDLAREFRTLNGTLDAPATCSSQAPSPEDDGLSYNEGQDPTKKHDRWNVDPLGQFRKVTSLLASHPPLAQTHEYDIGEHPTWDLHLLIPLLRHHQGHEDESAMISTWGACIDQGLRLPTTGLVADEVWLGLISSGLKNPDGLRRITGYAKKIKVQTGSFWSGLYCTIVGHFLWKRQSLAHSWHLELFREFPPTSDQFVGLINRGLDDGYDKRASRVLRQIYGDLPIRDIYAKVIPKLCRADRYIRALQWHQVCIEHRDFPPDAASSELLLRYLSEPGQRGSDRGLKESERAPLMAETLAKMSSAGIPIPNQFVRNLESIPRTSVPYFSRESLYSGMGDAHGIRPKEINDDFCARLIATKMITVGTAIRLLRMMSATSLGSGPLREIVLRAEGNATTMQTHLAMLQQNEISVADTTFNRLICKLSSEGNSQAILDILALDMHLDSFDDWRYQEELLRKHYDARNHHLFELTLSILTASKTTPQAILGSRWNIFLRMHVRNQDHSAIVRTLNRLHELHIPIAVRTLHTVRMNLISPRHSGRNPFHIADLPLVIAIYQRALKAGTPVPPTAWRDILRRLGMYGHLRSYERLALWLADWYSSHLPISKPGDTLLPSPKIYPPSPKDANGPANPTAPAASTSMSQETASSSSSSPGDPTGPIPPTIPGPVHITLTALFPGVSHAAMISWSFQFPFSPIASPSPRSPQWDWGLLLLRRLHTQYGVPVHRAGIALAVEHRMRQLFGQRRSRQRRNWAARERNTKSMEWYMERVEEIWGKGIWDDRRAEHVTGFGAVGGRGAGVERVKVEEDVAEHVAEDVAEEDDAEDQGKEKGQKKEDVEMQASGDKESWRKEGYQDRVHREYKRMRRGSKQSERKIE